MTMPTTLKSFLVVLVFSLAMAAQQPPKYKYVYWSPDKADCKICDSIRIDGKTLFGFETPDFDLVITGESYEDKIIYSQVVLLNKSKERIELDPAHARLALYKTRDQKIPQEFRPMEPEEAAKKVKGSQKLKNFFQAWGANMSRRSIFVDSDTDGSATIISPGRVSTVDYESQTRSTVSVPDERAISKAEAEIAERNARARARYGAVIADALRANTVFPDQMVKGNIYYPFVKGDFIWLALRVGDTIYSVGFGIGK